MIEDADAEFESVQALDDAYRTLRDVREEIERIGEDDIEAAVDAYRNAQRLLDQYADDATGTGDFASYVQFRGEYSTLVENLPESVPRRDVFEESLETVDKRRLDDGDFERARARLDEVRELVDLIERRETASARYRVARIDARDRLDELDDELAELDHVIELGEADLDAPTDRLREPIERYNEGVREAFREYRSEASAREFLGFVDRTRHFPLVEFPRPPAELLTYVCESPDGAETLPTLLEYAEYSRSKLVHYADDADALKRKIATQQTYLDRLDAEPLTVGWPPTEANIVRWRTDELRRVIGRFAPEDVVATLREIRRLAADDARFDRLRDAAVAITELDERDRERLDSGAIKHDRDRRRAERERLTERLEELPES